MNAKDYDKFPEDRIIMEQDIANAPVGQGIHARLIVDMMDKTGWNIRELMEWFTRGKVKAETLKINSIIVTRDIHKEEYN